MIELTTGKYGNEEFNECANLLNQGSKMSNEMSVEKRARKYVKFQPSCCDYMHSPEQLEEAFTAGWNNRDPEVQELKDVILDLFEGLDKIGSKQLESYGEMYELIASAYTTKHAPLIERLKKEREG